MSGMSGVPRPGWLPEGWVMDIKIRKDGREDKYYTSLSSGKTYRSKPEVLRCIGSVDIEKNVGQAPHFRSCFEDNKKNNKPEAYSTFIWQKNGIMTQVGDSPEWLPPGWITEFRTLHSGRRDKYYKHLSSGKTCHSKVEVMRYIESIDIKKNVGQGTNLTPCFAENKKKMVKQENRAAASTSCFGESKLKPSSTYVKRNHRTLTKIGVPPDWLPSGWIMEIKTRHNGRQYKYYKYLSSGKTCHSKVEVMRYIESIDIKKNVGQGTNLTPCFAENKKKMVKQENQAAASTSCFGESKLKASSTYVRRNHRTSTKIGVPPDWLPSGWIMAIKTRHNGCQYKCYSDPSTGYNFYSKKAVFRFLSNGQRSMETSFRDGCTSSDQRGSINNKSTENVLSQPDYSPYCSSDGSIKEIEIRKANKKRVKKDQTPIAAKKQIPRGIGVKRCLFAELAPYSNAIMTIKVDELTKKSEIPCQHQLPVQGNGGVRSICLSPNIKHLLFHGNAAYEGPVSVMPLNSVKPDAWRMKLYIVNEKQTETKEQENLQLSLPGNEEFSVQGDGLPEKKNLELMNEELSQPSQANLRKGRKRKYRKNHQSKDQGCSLKQEGIVQLRPRRTKAFKAITLPVRSSKRLAGIKADFGTVELPCRAKTKKSKMFRASPTNGINQTEESHPTPIVLDEEKIAAAVEVESFKEGGSHHTSGVDEKKIAATVEVESSKEGGSHHTSGVYEEKIAATVEVESFKEGGSHHTSGVYEEQKASATVGLQSLEQLKNEHDVVEEAAHAHNQVGEEKPGDDVAGSPLVLPFGDSWSDPCFEFAIKEGGSHHTSGVYEEQKAAATVGLQSLEKLENEHDVVEAARAYNQVGEEKPGDDIAGSPLVLPFGDSWSDPCFEFAIKTLTGDIPLFGDNAAIEEFFQQKLVSVQSPGPSSSAPLNSRGEENLQLTRT